jgi:acetyl-CoA C-acetyltransferase
MIVRRGSRVIGLPSSPAVATAVAVDPRTPVLVGAGAASDSAPVLDLIESAVRAAADDAGAPGLLSDVHWVAVTQGSWQHTDPARVIAERIGAPSARTAFVQLGVPQQTPVSTALARIRNGELDVAVVAGGEARAYERAHAEEQPEPVADGRADEVWAPEGEIVAPAEIAVRLIDAVQQYAIIENALRRAEDLTVDSHLDEIATLWAAFDAVAHANPRAAFGRPPRDAAFLRAAGPGNRPLAFPYAKWHSTQWTVDQAGALLLCSAETAERAGVPRDRWLFPYVALESSLALSLSRRRDLHRWPAMRALGERAAAHLGRPLRDVEHIDLYSCFPVAVRVQQRELDLPLDGVPTITGGMAFAGGPFNNYTYQSTAAMAEQLRADPGALGLISTVSGLLTKPGLAVWSATPPSRPALIDDLRVGQPSVPVHDVDPGGDITTVSYTVTYDGGGTPARAFVVGDAIDGSGRVVRRTEDAGEIERVLAER